MKLFKLKYIPLTIVVGFNLFTIFIFFTAPYHWETENLALFLFFSLSCQLMIVLGYKVGFKKSLKSNVSKSILFKFSSEKLNFIFLFYSLTFLIKYAYLLRFNIFDFKGMATRLITGIIDPHIGYALAINTSQATTVSWTIYYIISLFNQLFFIIGFIKWKEMNAGKKFLFTLFVLIELFYWMGQGTNFGTISMISTLAFVSMYKLKSFKLNPKRALRFYLIIILLFAGSIYTFSYTMVNRSGSSTLNLKAFDLGLSKVETNAPIFHFLPDKLQSTYMYMVSYLAQGYYHTCLAFDLDFKPTYFLGNNPALIDFARQMNLDVWQDTYVYRLREKGVDPLINWHSAYLWYASDVSLPGVPILLFFIGYLFGFSWGVSVRINDFLSKIVFVILANMLLYLFANNSYLSSIFYSFMLILPLWFITRVKHIKL